MYSWRVTKYNPCYRDLSGAYQRNDWTAVGDIGREFEGQVLTAEEYMRVESAYVETAASFMREAGVTSLRCENVEPRSVFERPGVEPIDVRGLIVEGAELSLSEVEKACRAILREDAWCRLLGDEAFLHFGYDYYMFVGCGVPCPKSVLLADELDLFVEEMDSPYAVLD